VQLEKKSSRRIEPEYDRSGDTNEPGLRKTAIATLVDRASGRKTDALPLDSDRCILKFILTTGQFGIKKA